MIPHRHRLDVDHPAVEAHDPELARALGVIRRQPLVRQLARDRPVLGMREREQARPTRSPRRVVPNSSSALALANDDPAAAVGEQRDRAGLDQAPIALLALAQRLLGRLELADVDADAVPDDAAVRLPGRRGERPEPAKLAAADRDPVVALERRQLRRPRLLDRREPGGAILGVDRVLQQPGVVGDGRGIEAVAQLDLRAVVGIADATVGVADAAVDHARDVVDDAAQLRLARAQLLGLAFELGDVAVQR